MRQPSKKLNAAARKIGITIPVLAFVLSAQAADLVQVQSFRTHSRFAVSIDEGIPVEWKKSQAGFELLLKGATLADLGAPLGEEKQWAEPFRELKDARIAGLEISEGDGAVRIVGRWKYPSGAAALAEPLMESFDYRSKSPAQFVVDVWHRAGPTLAEVEAQKKLATQVAKTRRAERDKAGRAQRKIASVMALRAAEDVGKFCREPMTEKTDVVLQFRPFHEPVNYSRWVTTTTPDSGFVYYEPTAKEPEAQYVRLALELYRQGKPALVIRTLDFFEAEHPKSAYMAEMRFLRANALIKLGLNKEAEDLITSLMASQKDSPVTLHGVLYQAVTRATSGQHLAALDSFQWLIGNYPSHRLNWLFHLGSAESYYSIRETERASKEYQWVVEHATERSNRADAATRLGDLFLDRLQYEQALAAYSQAATYFGKEAEAFPAYHLNRAETYYHLGQFSRAKEAFEQYLAKFSAHPGGWRATYRLGEIAARAGEYDVATRAYYDTVNRYPFSAGATLARLRLIPCGDHGGMDLASGQKFLEGEAETFDRKADVVMDRYPDYRGLAAVRALWSWTTASKIQGHAGAAARARDYLPIEAGIRELVSGKSPEVREILTPLLSALFRQRIERLLTEGKKAEAVSFYQQKSPYLPGALAGSHPGESDYLLRLSQAASDIGLGQVAERISAAYKTALSGRGPAADADVRTTAEKTLRLSEQKFTAAKALWVSHGEKQAEKIRALLAEVSEESPFSYEREIIFGLLDERAGQAESALKHAIRAQILRPAGSGDGAELGRLSAWVASLQVKVGDPKAALSIYRGVENQLRASLQNHQSQRTQASQTHVTKTMPGALETLGVPPTPALETVILAQAGILEEQGRWGEASAAYGRAREDGVGGHQVAFGQARALLRTGNPQEKAQGLAELEKLASAQSEKSSDPINPIDPWIRLAREALATEKSKNTNRKSAKEGTTP